MLKHCFQKPTAELEFELRLSVGCAATNIKQQIIG